VKLTIIALGQKMPAWVDQAFDDYARRLPRDWALQLVELRAAPRDWPLARILADEGERVLAAAGRATLVALDERGAAWTTAQFSQRLARWRDEATDVAFAIGSADGMADSVKTQATALLQLSAFTLPHGLARVMLVEQVYRAWSLAAGHPYHRA
jgi:23S rRNA (pseudouridine1915-N3)-methyltransferase